MTSRRKAIAACGLTVSVLAAPAAAFGLAEDEAAIRKHAQTGGFPVNRVSRVGAVIDPTTAD